MLAEVKVVNNTRHKVFLPQYKWLLTRRLPTEFISANFSDLRNKRHEFRRLRLITFTPRIFVRPEVYLGSC